MRGSVALFSIHAEYLLSSTLKKFLPGQTYVAYCSLRYYFSFGPHVFLQGD